MSQQVYKTYKDFRLTVELFHDLTNFVLYIPQYW